MGAAGCRRSPSPVSSPSPGAGPGAGLAGWRWLARVVACLALTGPGAGCYLVIDRGEAAEVLPGDTRSAPARGSADPDASPPEAPLEPGSPEPEPVEPRDADAGEPPTETPVEPAAEPPRRPRPPPGSRAPCDDQLDCAVGELCLFQQWDCTATARGVCSPGDFCETWLIPFCACDGTEFAAPGNCVTRAHAHAGPCP